MWRSDTQRIASKTKQFNKNTRVYNDIIITIINSISYDITITCITRDNLNSYAYYDILAILINSR